MRPGEFKTRDRSGDMHWFPWLNVGEDLHVLENIVDISAMDG